MYLSIKEFNNINDIPDFYNFNEPYIIRKGCKNMCIFNNDSTISSLYNILKILKSMLKFIILKKI